MDVALALMMRLALRCSHSQAGDSHSWDRRGFVFWRWKRRRRRTGPRTLSRPTVDQLFLKSLVIPLAVIVRHVRCERSPQIPFAQRHDPISAFVRD
jgi:hypothetical protein